MSYPFTTEQFLFLAIALFLIWTIFTYLLEGLRKTFLKPANSVDRIVYTLITNTLVGTVGGLLIIKLLAQSGLSVPAFTTPARTLISIAAGLTVGLALLALQKPATWEPGVLVRGYCQTLVVSIAEVIVCWVVLGGVVVLATEGLGGFSSKLAALLVASIAFGIYHLAHTAPFNTVKMVALLSVVGTLTGMFFLITKDLFGTIIFHNFLAVKGVLDSLKSRGLLDQFRNRQPVLIGTALIAVVALIITRIWLIS